MNNKSPLRYPGGKTRACKKLDSIFQEHFEPENFTTVISPFFGGGSFEFFLQNKYNYDIIANDKFKPLVNFWKMCKSKKSELCTSLREYEDINKYKFAEMRNEIMKLKNVLQQSEYYFILNRCSFSGSTLSGGFSQEASKKRFTPSSIDRIEKLNLSKFEITEKDFEPFLAKVNINKNTFIFLDPPYYLEKGSKLYGKNGDLHENFNHEKLFEVISTKTNWLMTYNDCEYIREMYKNFTIIEVNWSYGMNTTKKSSEIVIISN